MKSPQNLRKSNEALRQKLELKYEMPENVWCGLRERRVDVVI